jgi:nicotinamidase-related amidase
VAGSWVPVDSNHLEHALSYTKALEEKGRFVVCVWPEHCLIGTPGHAVVPSLNDALQEWVKVKMTPVEYVYKGMNCLTEMYSALAAEVPVADDPATGLNEKLIDRLHAADRVIICGEAKSHCVNYTMRDLADNWRKDPSALVLLNDCTSAVPGFEAAAEAFESDVRSLGCTVVNHAELHL